MVLFVEGKRDIPLDTKVNFPSRGKQTKLGTRSKDLDVLDNEREANKYYFKYIISRAQGDNEN